MWFRQHSSVDQIDGRSKKSSGWKACTRLFKVIICINNMCPPLHGCHICSLVDWSLLTHWGRVTHICVIDLTIIGSNDGLSPGRRQAIIWTNAGILLIGILGTNFSEILSEIHTFSCMKIHLKMSPAKWRPFCLGLDVLTHGGLSRMAELLLRSANVFSLQKILVLWLIFVAIS